MTSSEALRKRISDLCKKRNITINHLAQMSGLPHTTVDAVTRGLTTNPRFQTVYKIAIGLGMTISEFLNFPEMNEVEFDDFN